MHRDAVHVRCRRCPRINGSRFPFPRWSMNAPSSWRRSGWQDQQEVLPTPHGRAEHPAGPGALRRCGYALYRTSTRSSARKIYYYRCLGSEAWRYQGQARCSAQPIRLDLLEDTVWTEVARLLEDPALIQAELTRRVEAARTSHPAKQNQDRITRELLQAQRRADRLLTAYQEDLLSLDELRRRMPELRQRETRLKAELESLSAQLADQATYLRLAHTLGEFLERLRTQARGLDVPERQRVVRLLVKEVVVGDDSITIRHSIPNSNRSSGGPAGPVDPGVPLPSGDGSGASSLLRAWRDDPTLRCPALCRSLCREEGIALEVPGFQPLSQHAFVHGDVGEQPLVVDVVEGSHDTLPNPRTFRRSCAFSARGTRSRDRSFASTAAASAGGSCTCCWSCRMNRAR